MGDRLITAKRHKEKSGSDQLLTPELIKDKLAEAVKKAGGQRAWAVIHGVSEQYVCDVMQGRRGIGQKLAQPLGYRPVTRYEPFKE